MKYIITENKMEQVIIKYLNKMYGNLEKIKLDNHASISTLYVRNKKVYMELDINYTLWINYDTIWSDLENIFSLKYDEIVNILTKWVEVAYNFDDLDFFVIERGPKWWNHYLD